MDLEAMAAEVDAVNREKGWGREVTFDEALMLLASEVFEAFEAYREHGLGTWVTRTLRREYCPDCPREISLNDPSAVPCPAHPDKPEGVASEMADIEIRLLDTFNRFPSLGKLGDRLSDVLGPPGMLSGLWDINTLIVMAGNYWESFRPSSAARSLGLVHVRLGQLASQHGIDLDAEVRRKVDYNKTRPYRHGGKRI